MKLNVCILVWLSIISIVRKNIATLTHKRIPSNSRNTVSLKTVKEKAIRNFRHNSLNGNVYLNGNKARNKDRELISSASLSPLKQDQPLRIYFETSQLQYFQNLTGTSNNQKENIRFLLDIILPTAQVFFSQLLNISSTEEIINITTNTICNDENIKINQRIFPNIDLVIYTQGIPCSAEDQQEQETNSNNELYAYAFPCALNFYQDRPIIGALYLCLSFDYVNNFKVAMEIILHELIHVLGMNSMLFPYFRNEFNEILTKRPFQTITCGPDKEEIIKVSNKVMKRTNESVEIITPTVKQVIQNHFNCTQLEIGAVMEYSRDCSEHHWNERFFYNELMSTIHDENSAILSPVTCALLQDSSWYNVDFTFCKNLAFARASSGCAFWDHCIISMHENKVYETISHEFCNVSLVAENEKVYFLETPRMCNPTHTTVSLCDLVDFSQEIRHKYGYVTTDSMFPYFNSTTLGPMISGKADMCPMANLLLYSCADKKTFPSWQGEVFSLESKCFPMKFRVQTSASCFKTRCYSNFYKVFIEDFEFHCNYTNQEIDHPFEDKVSFICPSFYIICPDQICPHDCSGRGICDYDQSKCICFDENDTSPGCSNRHKNLGMLNHKKEISEEAMVLNSTQNVSRDDYRDSYVVSKDLMSSSFCANMNFSTFGYILIFSLLTFTLL